MAIDILKHNLNGWRGLGPLVYILALPGGLLFGEPLKVVEFSPLHLIEQITVDDTSCTALLDDDSNFGVEPTGDHSFEIVAKGDSSRSALLIVPCQKAEYQFALDYATSPATKRSFDLGSQVRPAASVGSTANFNPGGTGTIGVDYTDFSYSPLGFILRRTNFRGPDGWGSEKSADLNHNWRQMNLHYGVTDRLDGEGLTRTLRTDGGAYGNSVGVGRTKYPDGGTDREVRFFIQPPLALRLSESVAKDESRERRAQRTFYSAGQSLEVVSHVDFVQHVPVLQEPTSKTEFGGEARLNRLGSLQPRLDSKGTCRHGDQCYAQEFGLGIEYFQRKFVTKARYAPFPHQVSLEGRRYFGAAHEVSAAVVQQLEPLGWVKKQYWIDFQPEGHGTAASSFLHLEDRVGRWIRYVDHSLPLYSSYDSRRLILSRWGARFEGDRLSTGGSLSLPYGEYSGTSLSLDVRYFLDDNLGLAVERMTKKDVRGQVQGAIGSQPIAGAVVRLYREENLLSEQITGEDGNFAFVDVRCCGELQVKVTAGTKTANESTSLSKDTVTPTLNIKIADREKVPVKFFLDTNLNGRWDEKDQYLTIENFVADTGDCIVSVPDGICRGDNVWMLPTAKPLVFAINAEILPFQYRLIRMEGGENYTLGADAPLRVLLGLRKVKKP